MSTVSIASFDAWFTAFIVATTPRGAADVVATLPDRLSSGWRPTLDRARTLALARAKGHKGKAGAVGWPDVAATLAARSIGADASLDTSGTYCATCATDYAERGQDGAFGGLRLMPRTWGVGADGNPDPATVGSSGVPYGPPSGDDVRPLTTDDGTVVGFAGMLAVRQNACLCCRSIGGDERRDIIARDGFDGYRAFIAERWAERDEREARTLAARVDAERAAIERAAAKRAKAEAKEREAQERAARAADKARKAQAAAEKALKAAQERVAKLGKGKGAGDK